MCTATATLDTKAKIYEPLDLDKEKTIIIEKSPERSNLMYSFQCIDNDMKIQNIFNKVISEVREKGEKCTKTIIYCQTRKQNSYCIEGILDGTWECYVRQCNYGSKKCY